MSNSEKTIERLNRFIDAFLAIISTIMVLELPLPEANATSLKDLLPFLSSIGIFLVSFLLIIHFYLINMRYFNIIKKISGRALLMLIIWLGLLSLLPFFTRWMIDDHTNQTAILFFASLWVLVIVAHSLLFDFVIHDNFDRDEMLKQTKQVENDEFRLAMIFVLRNSVSSRISISVSLLLLLIAVLKPDIAYFLFLLSPIPLVINDTVDDQNKFNVSDWTAEQRKEIIRQLRYHTASREERQKMSHRYSKEIAKKYNVDFNDKDKLKDATRKEQQRINQAYRENRRRSHNHHH